MGRPNASRNSNNYEIIKEGEKVSEKIKEYPGHALKAEDFKEGKVLTTKWRPNAKYAWSAGIAVSRFLKELKNGKIIARKCNKCGRIMVPPRMFCEWCFKPTDEWVYVKDTGRIVTYSISYISAERGRLEKPMVVAVIAIDGASENMGILHKVEGVDIEEAKAGKLFGMRVKAVWKPPEEREGAITDIMYFKPLEEG